MYIYGYFHVKIKQWWVTINVLEMYLRTIGIFFWHSKGMLKKIILGSPHFSEGGAQWANFRGQVEIILDWFLTTIIFISM